jgi:prophage regulatory protein
MSAKNPIQTEKPTRTIDCLLSVQDVTQITGRSRSSIFRDVDKGTFPPPLKVGSKSNAWLQSEIAEWISNLPRRES